MPNIEPLSASLEDYLEAIFHIVTERQAARSKDISKRLQVNSSSVSGALHALAERQLINYSPYDFVTLTAHGKSVATDIVRRHETLRDFFVKVLAVEPEHAEEAACRMEHVVPRDILERFIRFIEFVETCPRGGAKWIEAFGYFCRQVPSREDCERCIESCLDDLKRSSDSIAKQADSINTLSDLRAGQKAKIMDVGCLGETGVQMVEMGVCRGTLVEVEQVAPHGSPIEIKVKGYHLRLNRDEASHIVVEPL